MNLPVSGWGAIGSNFSNHLFVILDQVVVNHQENPTSDDSSQQINVQTMADER